MIRGPHTLVKVLLLSALGALLVGTAIPTRVGAHQVTGESGISLYVDHCAACHGNDARGRGLIAPYLKAQVPDLTLISTRAGGAYPSERIFRIIDGQSEKEFTDRRHMPIWGYEFFGQEADDRAAHDHSVRRIRQLVDYLRSIQCLRNCEDRR